MAFPGLSNKLQRPALDSSHHLFLTVPRLPPAPLKSLPRFPAASSASLQRPMAFPAHASLQRPVAFSAGPFQPPAFSYGEVLERPVAFPASSSFLRFRDCRLPPSKPSHASLQRPVATRGVSKPFQQAAAPRSGASSGISSQQLFLTVPGLPPAPLKTLPRFPAASNSDAWRFQAFPTSCSVQW